MRLINDDCLKVLPTLPDKSVDLILTDPTYGTSACKWDSILPFEPMWTELQRIIKENKPIILFGSEPFSSYLRTSNIEWFRYDWIWEKQRGSILRAIANRPEIILADEPTGNLDPVVADEIIDLLEELSESIGTSILMSTHNYPLIKNRDKLPNDVKQHLV